MMKNIIYSILSELKFATREPFSFQHEETDFKIMPFFSGMDRSQVFLIFYLLESQLLQMDFLEVLPNIAEVFRKVDEYESDMQKNTSLVLCVERDINSERLVQMQIAIEDDPYYFKKYVFSYLNDDPQRFVKLKEEYKLQSNIEFIQTYVLNAEHFHSFRDNVDNDSFYRLVSDLLIKIPIMPIEFNTTEGLRTVESYFNDENIASMASMLDTVVQLLNDSDTKDIVDITDTVIKIWENHLDDQLVSGDDDT